MLENFGQQSEHSWENFWPARDNEQEEADKGADPDTDTKIEVEEAEDDVMCNSELRDYNAVESDNDTDIDEW